MRLSPYAKNFAAKEMDSVVIVKVPDWPLPAVTVFLSQNASGVTPRAWLVTHLVI